MTSAAAEQISIIDELGEVQRLLAPTKALFRRESELKKKVEGFCADVAPDQGHVLEGNVYRVIVGPRATRRVITSMKRLYQKLGVAQFLKFCTFPLSMIDDLGVDTDGILSEDRSGPRTFLAVLRDPASAMATSVAGRNPRKARDEVRA